MTKKEVNLTLSQKSEISEIKTQKYTKFTKTKLLMKKTK